MKESYIERRKKVMRKRTKANDSIIYGCNEAFGTVLTGGMWRGGGGASAGKDDDVLKIAVPIP